MSSSARPTNSLEHPDRGVMALLRRPISLFPPGLARSHSEVIRAAELPAPLANLADTVVRRSRLWPLERLDVARELIAHFRDGLESGAAPDELARAFGDPTDAARLIRRAKRRCRPLAWRASIRVLQSLGALIAACIVIFLFGAARAFLSHPTVSRDIAAELNAPIARTPEADRAWPLYRSAYLSLPRMPEDIAKDFPAIRPGDQRWPATLEYLKRCSDSLAFLRQAAARPWLGRELSNSTDAEMDAHSRFLSGIDADKAREGALLDAAQSIPETNPPLIGVLLPHLGQGRHFARVLAFDCHAAAVEKDHARAASDLETMFRLAEHMGQDSFLIGNLVELAIHALACQTLGEMLDEHPNLFSNAELAALAHAASRTPPTVPLRGERLFMDDMLQRVYTDNGRGDGHLTAEGLRFMRSMSGTPWRDTPDAVREALEIPLVSLVGASRKGVREVYDRLLDSVATYAVQEPWDRPDFSPSDEVERLSSTLDGKRYLLISLMIPSFTRAVWAHDETVQRSGAALVAIALEIYRRENARHPAELDEIPRSMLPAVPRDIFDGRPLRYVVRDGKPLVYSIGTDLKDDGGRPVKGAGAFAGRRMSRAAVANTLASRQADTIDGDWILWPPQPTKPPPSLN